MWFTSLSAPRKSSSFRSRRPQPPEKPHRRVRPALEALEDRLVLSQLTVTSALDPATPTAGTLRYAINQANVDGAHGIADDIEFQHNLNGAHFLLQEGPLVLTSGAAVSIWTIDPSFPGNELQITLNGDGSGIFHVDQGATLDLHELTLAGGDANASTGANGGAINNAGILTINICNFVDNTATGMGGAIYNTGTLTGTYSSTFTGNSAELGGGIANAAGGKVSLSANFSSNSASGNFGGAVYNDGVMKVAGTLDGNTAQYDGGAIYNDGVMTVAGTLDGNSTRNSTQGNGGAIYNDQKGTMTVSTCTLANNSAPAGGAISNGGALTLTATTVSGNSALYGGGIATQNSLTLVDTIVAGNILTSSSGKDPDIDGSVAASSAYNLIGNGTGLSGISNGVNHNQIGTSSAPINPRLAALASNGGSVETMAPQAGSPAIKAGGNVTTLTSAVSAQATVIPVADAAAIASTALSTMIQIDDEFLEVTNVNLANNTLTVVRVAAPIIGEVATSHNAGAAVYLAWGSDYGALVTDPDIGAYQPPAGPVTSFSVTGPSASGVVAGTPFNVTITAEDANGDPELTGAWSVTLTSSDGQTVHSSPIALKNGTATVSVVLDKADKLTLTASAGSITGTSSSFTVYGAAAASFTLSAPSTVIAGAGFSLKVTAFDAFGNIATKYGGTATLTSSDGQTVWPNMVDFNSFGETPAVVTMTVFLDKVDTLTLKATAGSIKSTSNKITVNPAAAASFVVSAPSTVIAGTGFSVEVTAFDRFGNIATGYGGTATITSSDRQTVSPSTVSFGTFGETPGVAATSVILDKAGTVSLTVAAGAVTGTSKPITIDAVTEWSQTWCGYVIAPGSGVTAVGDTWIQPAASGPANAQNAIWVGIDGANGSTVEQCGTWTTVVNGVPQYSAWYELFGDQKPSNQNPNPNPQGPDYNAQTISGFAVHPGDTISAEVSLVSSHNNWFLFQMTDKPQGGGAIETYSSVQKMVYVVPIRATAEWIVEDPNNGSQPLANFGQVNFTGAWATVGSTTGSINSDPIPQLWNMGSSTGNAYGSNPPVSSNVLGFNEPAAGASSSSFTVTYGIAPSSGGTGGASRASSPPAGQAAASASLVHGSMAALSTSDMSEPLGIGHSVVKPQAMPAVTSQSVDRFDIHDFHQRIADRVAPGGLTNSQGHLLDDADDGQPGSDGLATLMGLNPAIDPLAPKSPQRSKDTTVSLKSPSASAHVVSHAAGLFARSLAFPGVRRASLSPTWRGTPG